MKIAVLTSGILPVPAVLGGAVENLVDYYLEYNDQKGIHDVTVYSVKPSQSGSYGTEHTHYHFIDMKAWWERIRRVWFVHHYKGGYYHSYIEYFLHRCLPHIRKSNYDVIVLENRPGYALKLSQMTNAKLVIHLHNDFLNADSTQAKEICDACSLVITVSDYIKKRVLSVGSDVPVQTVHNGIDLQRFYSAQAIDRSVLGFDQEDFVVVYSGRINPEKGIKELIQAIKRLKSFPRIKLLVLGGCFFGNETVADAFMVSLQKEVEEISDRIRFTGFVPYDHVPSYLKVADVAVIPSKWEEPFALTVVEAMAAGLPVIATNSGGIPEVCGETSYLVSLNDISSGINKVLVELYYDVAQRRLTAMKGLKKSIHFSKEIYCRRFFSNFSNL